MNAPSTITLVVLIKLQEGESVHIEKSGVIQLGEDTIIKIVK